MRTHFMFHTLVFFMAVLTFSVPFGTLAQQNSWRSEAKIAAERDASTDVNKRLWFGAGCLFLGASSGCLMLGSSLGDVASSGLLITGIAGSYFHRPDPPAERLLGKSPEYVAFYTDAYKAKAGKLQATWTTAGCASGVLAAGAVVLVGLIAYTADGGWPP